jgi:two-component system NtrC family sensor kinase
MRWYSSLTFKLIATAGFTTAILIGLLTFLIISAHRGSLINEVIKAASDLSETIRKGTYYDMLEDRRENVYRSMQTIAEQSDILRLRIFSKEGKITFSTDTSEKGTFVDKNAEACFVCHSKDKPLTKLEVSERTRIFKGKDGSRVLGMVTAIYNEPACYSASCHVHPRDKRILGTFDIDISIKSIDDNIFQSTTKMVLFSFAALIVLFFIIWLSIRKFVTKPVKDIVKGMRKVANGDLNYKIDEEAKDEMGYLIHSYNKMASDLTDANKKIHELIENLEEKVQKKTKELMDIQSHFMESEKLASIGRLAASVAHELNNPLGSILLYNNLTLEDIKEENETKENIRKSIQETLRARDIIKGLLEFARPKNLEIKLTDINEIVNKTLDLLTSNKALFSNIILNTDLYSGSLPSLVDSSQIQQVITNLMINALEAVKEKGSISVKTRLSEDGKMILISISDTGCGIPEENIKKLFEPFFSTKADKGGTGLGLAVSYSILTRHKGKIEVQSQAGKGSTFTAKLPVYRE